MLRVVTSGVYIPLRDLGLTFPVGKRLPLFQETRDYYVVKVSTPEYGERLCAFPVRNRRGEGTAWVTNEKLLIFGRETSSCAGRFYLARGEVLPVIATGPSGYLVEITRFGRKVQMVIPRDREGLEFVKLEQKKPPEKMLTAVVPREAEEVAARETRQEKAEAVKPVTVTPVGRAAPPQVKRTYTATAVRAPEAAVRPVERAASGTAETKAAGIEKKATAAGQHMTEPAEKESTEEKWEEEEYIIEIEIPPELRPGEAAQPRGTSEEPKVTLVARAVEESVPEAEEARPAEPAGKTQPVASQVVATAVGPGVPAEEEGSAAVIEKEKEKEESRISETAPPQPVVPAATGYWGGWGMIALQVVLVVVIIEAVLIVRLKRQLAVAGPAVSEQVDFSTLAAAAPTDFYVQLAEKEGDFSGVLVNFSLAELTQLLHNNEDTGVLLLKNSEGSIIGQFFFKNGEVIDAYYQEERGSDAFRRAFEEEANIASFAFKRKELSGRRRTIREQTVNLLMDVVKDIDQAGGRRGGGASPDLGLAE